MSADLAPRFVELAPWTALVVLGAFHGLNPAMGWLFAVALGLQERRRSAVLQALPLIALGHEASIAVVVALVSGLQIVAAPEIVRPLGALALVGFGAFKLLRPRAHLLPRWVGFRVGRGELLLWSFLMSTAHGAGLMLFPVVLGLPPAADAGRSFGLDPVGATVAQNLAAVVVHTLAMLGVMAAVALVVYEKLGVAFLRTAWVNLDTVWAAAIVVAGLATLFS